jgi:hypothetical protein
MQAFESEHRRRTPQTQCSGIREAQSQMPNEPLFPFSYHFHLFLTHYFSKMNLMNRSVIAVLAVILIAGLGYMFYQSAQTTQVTDAPATSPTPLVEAILNNDETFTLDDQNDSNQEGEVTFIDEAGKTRVILQVNNPPVGVAQPAHIHVGSCPEPGAIQYPLTSVVDGKSETLLDVSMETLESQQPLAVNVHKSPTETAVYVACGNINL